MADLQDILVNAKDQLPNVTPTPPAWHPQATAHELKSRLNWGEPGLTILDVRDRNIYLEAHIQGAINMDAASLPDEAVDKLQFDRDLYIYSTNDAETAAVANALREAGFQHVAELKGGLDAWREIRGAVEGNIEVPSPGAYNVVSRLQEFADEKAKERSMDS